LRLVEVQGTRLCPLTSPAGYVTKVTVSRHPGVDALPTRAGGSQTEAWNPIPPAQMSPHCKPERDRERMQPASSVNPLHQLVPRATESLTQARSHRHSRLRAASLHPLKVGAVDLGKLAQLLLRETRFCPQTGEISAEDIRRRHPSSLTIPVRYGRRIYAAFSLRISCRPASIFPPTQAWGVKAK